MQFRQTVTGWHEEMGELIGLLQSYKGSGDATETHRVLDRIGERLSLTKLK